MNFRLDTAFITDFGETFQSGKFLEQAGLIYEQRNLAPWVIHYGFKSIGRGPLPPQGCRSAPMSMGRRRAGYWMGTEHPLDHR